MKSLLPKPKPIHPAKIFELVCSCTGVKLNTTRDEKKIKAKIYAKQSLIYLLKTQSKLNYHEICDLTNLKLNFVKDNGHLMLKRMDIETEAQITHPSVILTLEILKYLEPI